MIFPIFVYTQDGMRMVAADKLSQVWVETTSEGKFTVVAKLETGSGYSYVTMGEFSSTGLAHDFMMDIERRCSRVTEGFMRLIGKEVKSGK